MPQDIALLSFPYKPGNYYSSASDVANIEKSMLDGREIIWRDHAPGDPSVLLTGADVYYRLVKNGNASAVTSNTLQKWKATKWGTQTDGAAAATDYPAGVVDPLLGTGVSVPAGAYYFAAFRGPTYALSSASYSEGVILAAASSGKTAAASSPPTDNDIGYAMEEATDADQVKRIWLNLH